MANNRFATDPQIEQDEPENGDMMPPESVYFKNNKRAPMPVYRHKDYPRVKYHESEPPITVIDAEDEASLGKGWGDVPVRKGFDAAGKEILIDGDRRPEPRRTR